MEDLRRRIKFNNSSIQLQAVWKIHTDLVKKLSAKGELLSAGITEPPEVKLLWDTCTDQRHVVAQASCRVLVELVCSGLADFTYILNGLLNLVPSAKNLTGVVSAIGELLVLQFLLLKSKNEKYKCPYSLRSPPHPFITVLTNRPESWQLLQQQINNICFHGNQSVRQSSLQILGPFIEFSLLEPQQSIQYQPMRFGLQRSLLHVARESEDPEVTRNVIKFFVKVIPLFQIQSSDNLGFLCQFLVEILHLLTPRSRDYESELQFLAEYSLTLCEECIHNNHTEMKALTDALLNVLKAAPKVLSDGRNVVTIANLLLAAPLDDVGPLLQCVKYILKVDNLNISATVVAMVILPLLQVLALPRTAGLEKTLQMLQSLAAEVMTLVERQINMTLNSGKETKNDDVAREFVTCLTASGYTSQTVVRLSQEFTKSPQLKKKWLQNLPSILSNVNHVPISITNMVAALLVVSRESDQSNLALQSLVKIATQDVNQAPYFLPLLLYKLGREGDPEQRLMIMKSIPAMARHKVCVAPILKTIQMLGSSPKLKAISINLLTDLWKLQERCYPQLLKAITESVSMVTKTGGLDEILLAKATAIREVCKSRPEQHGADLLGPLSDILNSAVSESDAPVAALLLEGLYYLCEAEVIEIRSAWTVLSDRLSLETRPVVVEKICDLFSLVPALEVQTPEYESFAADILRRLWLFTQVENGTVSRSAFQALSLFKADEFKLSHFPQQIITDFIKQAQTIADQQEQPDLTLDQIIDFVPGVCYIRLMRQLETGVLQDYESFISSLVAKEVENLPRGIYHSSLRRQGTAANQGKAIGSIPSFVLSQYEKTKQPGLRPGLAVALLFCYDPPVEVGRDGRPRKHYLLSHSKNFQQMFSTLLHEVPVQPSEWHRCLLMPQAWTSFIDRLFTSMIEGRRAELDLQLKREHITEGEAKEKQDIAWLWVRDQLVNTIKITSRGNPAMQSNSVYALAGLAVTVNRFVAGQEEETMKAAEDSTEFLSHSHWVTVTIDTIMSLMDVKYKPKGTILGLCQQRTVSDRLPASVLAQAAASVALSQLVPILITKDVDRIYDILTKLINLLPGHPGAQESPVLKFHYGLGVGMFLARLFEEHFSDVTGNKGIMFLWKTLDKFEDCCLSTADYRSGALLGLGVAISALSEEGKTESRAHVSAVYDKLMSLWENTDVKHESYQALSVCVSCVAGSSFSSNILQVAQVNTVIDKMLQQNQDHPENLGVCLSLGMLCYSLGKVGHPSMSDVKQGLFYDYFSILSNQNSPPMQKVACLNGLFALAGSERTLIPIQSVASLSGADNNTDNLIKIASQIAATGGDLGIQSNSAWMLGHLYLSACAVAETRASVPPSYTYLPESSVLRAVVDFLLEAGKSGPEFVNKEHVKISLTSIYEDITRPLPPVNWAGLLTPLMRMNFGIDVKEICLKIAVQQSGSAPTAAMFLSSWLQPSLFNTLNESCQSVVFGSLHILIKSISPAQIRTFLEKSCMDVFDRLTTKQTDNKQCLDVLQGLSKALQINDPPDTVCVILFQAVERFYAIKIPDNQILLYQALGECLSHIPDALLDKITEEDFLYEDRQFKGCFVRCYLVAHGKQAMPLLNSCIDATLNNPKCDHQFMLHLLGNCFYHLSHTKTEHTGVLNKIQWFLELLGHVKNVASGAITLSDNLEDKNRVVFYAVSVVVVATCMWLSETSAAVLGLDPNLLKNSKHDSSMVSRGFVIEPVSCLPIFLRALNQEPWEQILPKFTDWLTTMTSDLDTIETVLQENLRLSLMMLRHSSEFRRPVIWTKVVSTALF